MNKYYFTFRKGHRLEKFVQPIVAETPADCEEIMFKVFGDTWKAGYSSKGQEVSHLTELPTIYAHVDMTIGEMNELTKRYQGILSGNPKQKDLRLSIMMTDMEQAYAIPFINNEKYNARNPHVVSMYRTLSESRELYEQI